MQMTRNNEEHGVACGVRNRTDESDIEKLYTGKRRVTRSRTSALPENSTTPKKQRRKESMTAVPAHGNGCQQFAKQRNRLTDGSAKRDQPNKNRACGNGNKRCDLPTRRPKREQLTVQNPSGQDDNNDESDEGDVEWLRTLQQLNGGQRALVKKTRKLYKTEKNQLRLNIKKQKRQRQLPVRDQCAPASSESCCLYDDQKMTMLDRPAAVTADGQQICPCRVQCPSSSSLTNCSRTEGSDDGQMTTIDTPDVATNGQQCPCSVQYPWSTSLDDCSRTEDSDDGQLTTIDTPEVAANGQQCPCRVQYPSSTSLDDCSRTENSNDGQLTAIDRPAVTVDRQQCPRRVQCQLAMSSLNASSTENEQLLELTNLSSWQSCIDEQLLQSSTTIDRSVTAEADRQQKPCSFQYPSPTSSADCIHAGNTCCEQRPQLPRTFDRQATTETVRSRQQPCRFQYRSPTSSADCIHAENTCCEQRPQLLRAFDRPAATETDRSRQQPCRFQYPPSLTFTVNCTYAENNSDEQLLKPCFAGSGLTDDGCWRRCVSNALQSTLPPPQLARRYSDYWTPEEATFDPHNQVNSGSMNGPTSDFSTSPSHNVFGVTNSDMELLCQDIDAVDAIRRRQRIQHNRQRLFKISSRS